MHGQKGPAQASYALAVYLFAPLAIIVPLTVSSAVGAHTIVGERERGSGEFLAHSPATERQIYLGKLMASLIPGYFTAAIGFLLYSLVVNLIVGPKLGGWFFPTDELVGPHALGAAAVHRARAGGDPRDLGAGVERGRRAAGVGAGDAAADRHRVRRVEQHAVPRRELLAFVIGGARVAAARSSRCGARRRPSPANASSAWAPDLDRTRRSRRAYSPPCTRASRRSGSAWRRHPRRDRRRCRATRAVDVPRGRRPRRALRGGARRPRASAATRKVALFRTTAPSTWRPSSRCRSCARCRANVNFRYLGDELAQLVDNADAEVLVYHRSLARRVSRRARDRMPRLLVDIDRGSTTTAPRRRRRVRGAPRARTSRAPRDRALGRRPPALVHRRHHRAARRACSGTRARCSGTG